MKEYVIGGKKFSQKTLVIAQWSPLLKMLEGLQIPEELDIKAIVGVLGGKLPQALAIILREDGKHLKEKNVEELTAFLEDNLELPTALEVVSDFFDLTPINSSLSGINGLMEKLASQMKTGQNSSDAFSPVETSQEGTV